MTASPVPGLAPRAVHVFRAFEPGGAQHGEQTAEVGSPPVGRAPRQLVGLVESNMIGGWSFAERLQPGKVRPDDVGLEVGVSPTTLRSRPAPGMWTRRWFSTPRKSTTLRVETGQGLRLADVALHQLHRRRRAHAGCRSPARRPAEAGGIQRCHAGRTARFALEAEEAVAAADVEHALAGEAGGGSRSRCSRAKVSRGQGVSSCGRGRRCGTSRRSRRRGRECARPGGAVGTSAASRNGPPARRSRRRSGRESRRAAARSALVTPCRERFAERLLALLRHRWRQVALPAAGIESGAVALAR